jgi:hypothetical protein
MQVELKEESMTQNTVAKIVQGALVVSLKNAKNPTVWRARLDRLDEARFSVESGGKGVYRLQLNNSGKTAGEEIASFTTKSAAEQALAAITDVLFNLEDIALTAPVDSTAQVNAVVEDRVQKAYTGWRIFYWLVFVLIFLVGFLFFASKLMSFVPPGSVPAAISGAQSGAANGGLPDRPNKDTMGGDIDDMPEPPAGRPLSADDYFKDR